MANVLDSLAYVDSYDASVKSEIERLIAEEMQRSDKTLDFYLAQLEPEREVKFSSPSLQAEWEQLCQNEGKVTITFDVDRYKVSQPPRDQNDDLPAWISATNNARSQLEHQKAKTVNLELLNRFGAHQWRLHNEQLVSQNKIYQNEIERLNHNQLQVNRKRKADQMGAAPRLEQLESNYFDVVKSNIEVSGQNEALKLQIAQLRQQLPQPLSQEELLRIHGLRR
jgi:hypothetical protein